MLRRNIAIHALAVSLAGCTSTQSGSQLWKRACQHLRTIDADALPPMECEREFAALPPRVADDFARCGLKLSEPDDADGTLTRACLGSDGTAFLAKADDTIERLEAHAAAVEAHRETRGRLPSALREVADAEELTDGWGRRFTYAVEGETFSVCSAGRNGVPNDDDDLCLPPSFIYFDF
ncbi:MAG: hypothetical protein ACRBN8_40600 [Nannocystales bacterium]